jgi:DNA-binding transcriptional LysR family regulator
MDRSLRQFLAVAETGSITAACERLHITQPTVTVSIRKLEEAYGAPLFERSSRGMVLTDCGTILYDHARGMARLEAHARDEIAARKAGEEGPLRLGCGYTWWHLFVREVVQEMQRASPRRRIHVEVGSSLDGLSALLTGDAVVFVGHRVPELAPSVGAAFEPLFPVVDGFFVRAGHPLLGRPCAMADLAGYDIADTVPVRAQHRPMLGPSDRAALGRPPAGAVRRVVGSNALTVCLDLMRMSDAVLTYPAVIETVFAVQGIERLDVTDPPSAKPVGIYALDERSRDPQVVDLRSRIREAAERCPLLSASDTAAASPRSIKTSPPR